MTCYFKKRDTIAVELSFFSKILKYRLYNMDSSSAGVALNVAARHLVAFPLCALHLDRYGSALHGCASTGFL